MRHLSQALRTRLRTDPIESRCVVDVGEGDSRPELESVGDMFWRDRNAKVVLEFRGLR